MQLQMHPGTSWERAFVSLQVMLIALAVSPWMTSCGAGGAEEPLGLGERSCSCSASPASQGMHAGECCTRGCSGSFGPEPELETLPGASAAAAHIAAGLWDQVQLLV